ncbi:tetratricopeptide repeat protein [Xylanibacter muris]|uniref:Tetratricopeptide repeat protein n=1 Tax=Xylanibacter muris TaxID=2736290 RepID=A0ABX2ANF8_9BACT|nr:tetratricopeptide repeat protein [Xylanibacter muris]NPD91466.1 tetratricopeptide repeat protein [Xylanibacter muris]
MSAEYDFSGLLEMTHGGNLAGVIHELENMSLAYPELGIDNSLRPLREEYYLMLEYWSRGYKDDDSGRRLESLISRFYTMLLDLSGSFMIRKSSFLTTMSKRLRSGARDWSADSLRVMMEDYVSDMALLELEPAHVREERMHAVMQSHYQAMDDLFCYVYTSGQWTPHTAEAYTAMLLSPTVDSADQQLVVSAVTLACMRVFDVKKVILLTEVYRRSTDEYVRQRALVGWALCCGGCRGAMSVYPDALGSMRSIMGESGVADELVDLQKQLIYTFNADKDARTINEEIMPGLLKNSDMSITLGGIKENDADPLADILNPNQGEGKIEQLEAQINRMKDMEKAGSDIYFGGFSQMKRFPFFSRMSNWLMPFNLGHPDLWQYRSALKGNSAFLDNILKANVFCNSDRYSFAIVVTQMMDRIPENMREMLNRPEALGMALGMPGATDGLDTESPIRIRRLYLQDLMRFFRLYSNRSELPDNPFNVKDEQLTEKHVFLASPVFDCEAVRRRFVEVCTFLSRFSGTFNVAEKMLLGIGVSDRDFDYNMLLAGMYLRESVNTASAYMNGSALEYYANVLDSNPDDARALYGYGKCCLKLELYDKAVPVYSRLMEMYPDNAKYTLCYCMCMVKLGNYDEARPLLFRIDYEHPGNALIKETLAVTLIGQGEYGSAKSILAELIQSSTATAAHYRGYAYCLWAEGDIVAAAGNFVKCIESENRGKSRESLLVDIYSGVKDADFSVMFSKDISDEDIRMMCEYVYRLIVSGE